MVPRVRPSGVLLVDDVLWSGRVVDVSTTEEDTVALRAFNDKVGADERVEAVVLTAFDGVTIARKMLNRPASQRSTRQSRHTGS
jgi:caffeoyl-CoA O-methyltransferase